MNRIENIQRWKVRQELKKVAEEEAKNEHLAQLTADIEALWDRAKVLIEVYNEGKKVGMPYPTDTMHQRCFSSNSWSHHIGVGYYYPGMYHGNPGFGDANRTAMNAISIRGGGACDYEIDLCNGKLHYTGDALARLERFVTDYNYFEKMFYDWIDEHTNSLA